MNEVIPQIVIGGGPCAGKTTGIPFLSEKLSDAGQYPIVVPEAPTLLMRGNVSPMSGVFDEVVFQEAVIRMMMALEEIFVSAAKKILHKHPVLLCDRGIMDALAYCEPQLFWQICKNLGLDASSARDKRYHAIIHMRTAALGAEKFYTHSTNIYRRETLEEARVQDEKTLAAWRGHPHVIIIGNEGITFEQKLQRLFQATCRILEIPVPIEIEEKYLVEPITLDEYGVEYTAVEIEQIYLTEPEGSAEEIRIRRRGQGSVYTYYETHKRKLRPGVRVETERFINEREYELKAQFPKENTVPIRKKRHCFVYQNQYFELDIFDSPHAGLHLLEIECTEEHSIITLPPFIKVVRRVTDDQSFSNASLAHIG